jgi:hypothetical protein
MKTVKEYKYDLVNKDGNCVLTLKKNRLHEQKASYK